jgi:hypothetical protein
MGLLSAHDYNEYKTFKLPVFGGTVPILFDEDLFSVDVAFSSGLSTEEIKPLSWDESRVLVLSEGRLHFVGRHNYIALFGGVICPYCQAMVYFHIPPFFKHGMRSWFPSCHFPLYGLILNLVTMLKHFDTSSVSL